MRIPVLLLPLFLTLASAAERPNILLIYTDDQGYGDAASLNPKSKFPTPALDRLAAEGMTFTDAHCSDTVCTPSRYGLLTGRYSWRTRLKTGVFGSETPCLIEDGRTTIASLLRDHGYATAMIGKWHLGMDFPGDRNHRDWSHPVKDMPLDKGFDYFFGIPASMNFGILAWFEGRYAKVPPTLYTEKKPSDLAIKDFRIMPPYDEGLTDLALPDDNGNFKGPIEIASDFVDSECLTKLTDKTLEWLDSRPRDKPFFIYLPYTSPHKPVVPIEKFRGKSEAGGYGDFMMETDWHIGQILDYLDKNDLAENTLVILSSDNGPENTWPIRQEKYGHDSNGIYRDGKRSIYEGGHRVPFFVRWPEEVEGGTTYDGPVCQTDVLATVAEMLKSPLPDNSAEDSVSFYDVLMTGKATDERPAIVHHGANGRFAIRQGPWKLVLETKKKGEVRELYDLEADPEERHPMDSSDPETDLYQKETALLDELTRIVKSGHTTPGKTSRNDTGWWDDLFWMEKW